MSEGVRRIGGVTPIGLGKKVLGKKPAPLPLCPPENRKGSDSD
jgi:hypothetical protein